MLLRKLFLIGVVLLAGSAQAATFKIATLAPDGTVWMKQLREAAAKVETETEGRIKFKFYPGGVMGDAATVRRKMRVGQLQGGAFTGGELAEVDPNYFLYSLPFLFRDQAEIDAIRKQLDPRLADTLREAGMEILGLAGGGFAFIMSDHPVRTEAELSDSRVWVPDNDPMAEIALRESGVAPIPLPLSDVYTAMQTGVIDTVMNTEVGAIAFQWHTKIKHVVDLPLAYVIGAVVLDRRAFNKIDPTDQLVLKGIFDETFAALEELNQQDNAGAREALKNQGIAFIELDSASQANWQEIGEKTILQVAADEKYQITELEYLKQLLDKHRQSLAAQAQ